MPKGRTESRPLERSSSPRNGETSWVIGVFSAIETGESSGTGGSSGGFFACWSSRGDDNCRPDRWTELFSLTEPPDWRPATVRAECQKTVQRFRDAGRAPRQAQSSKPPSAVDIDERLHAERLDPTRSKPTYMGILDDLPDGVFITLEERKDQAFLIEGIHYSPWSPGLSGLRRLKERSSRFSRQNPQWRQFARDCVPQIHPSAGAA